MKVFEVIHHLEQIGTWVNWNKTRDIVLHGKTDKEITKMGVCWVVTNQVIEQAKEKGINFIISHENPFYEATTSPDRLLLESANKKRAALDEADMTVYRCHDVWDKLPVYGVVDTWARDMDLDFEPRPVHSYHAYANVSGMTVADLANHVVQAVSLYGQDAITVIGDLNRSIHRVAIGTGAACYVFEMLKENPDVLVVSDDSIKNWIEVQWCIDHDLPILIVNHATCEIGGIQQMVNYFHDAIPELAVEYLNEGFHVQSVQSNSKKAQ